MDKSYLKGKTILVVDDEPDVLEALAGTLSVCDVVKAGSFIQAKELLETRHIDIAILDIMGVDGYKLLDIANERGITAIMLTAHALTPQDTVKSFKKGAALYVPKEKLGEIEIFLADVIEAKQKGRSSWWRWVERLGSYYDKRFGPDWRSDHEDFWKKFPYDGL
jgi:DNA-binding NtrC family response regulator